MTYFKNFMGTTSAASGIVDMKFIKHGLVLSVEQQLHLIRPFLAKELKNAMFNIDSSKSPRFEGYGAEFFKASWNVVGNEIVLVMNDFFSSFHLPKGFAAAVPVLIPKVSNPSIASDFRPISCCRTIYKCIAKLLCGRLIEILPNLINGNQGAFVKGRSIAHNVLINQDLLRVYGRANTSPRCMLKIDLSKA